MKFRPCIDLHNGQVKQIVGSTLDSNKSLKTNFIATHPSEWFASLYKKDKLTGGHIIKLGQGNDDASINALKAYPNGMQIGGGITIDNAKDYINAGASHIIVTSWIFDGSKINFDKLKNLTKEVGKDKLVLDLSCRKKNKDYHIVTDRWQTFTGEIINTETLNHLSTYCDEFLIHGVDVEGMCAGIEKGLVEILGNWAKIPITYAGGITSEDDILLIKKLGKDKIDFTIGSALDIFGGESLKYEDIAGKYS